MSDYIMIGNQFEAMEIASPLSRQHSPEVKSIQIQARKKFDKQSKQCNVLLSITTPCSFKRNPIDMVVVIDVSGSMSSVASTKACVENNRLSILDIVKHAVKTIISTLNDQDRLALVTFSTTAKTIFELTLMTEEGKEKAMSLADSMIASGRTNLWDGLEKGLTILQNGRSMCHQADQNYTRNSTIFVLTDGVPNIIPPRGHLPMMNKFKNKHGGSYPGTINTFGFGYDLDSKLLEEIALEGNGMYYFIPDSGYVGTNFVNALANELSVMIRNCTLTISSEKATHQEFQVIGHQSTHKPSPARVSLALGSLQFDQRRDVLIKCSNADDILDMTFEFNVVKNDHNSASNGMIYLDTLGLDKAEEEYFYLQECRCEAVDYILSLVADTDRQKVDVMQSELVQKLEHAKRNEVFKGLYEDLSGQVNEAISNPLFYDKWGRHFLPSLLRAHSLQICTNFKDPGLQNYGGSIFRKLRDDGEDIFCQLPPPQGTLVVYSESDYNYANTQASTYYPIATAVNNSFNDYYYNCSAPCFAGNCLVTMADQSTKPIVDIRKGDKVKCHSELYSSKQNVYAEVLCIVKTVSKNVQSGKSLFKLVELESGLLVTPWHPIYEPSQQRWCFPCELAEPKLRECDAVYSFILGAPLDEENQPITNNAHASSMIINDEVCITLGHGIEGDDVATHEFFGTEAVVNALKECDGFEKGCVILREGCIIRDQQTNLVIGFRQD